MSERDNSAMKWRPKNFSEEDMKLPGGRLKSLFSEQCFFAVFVEKVGFYHHGKL